MECSETVNPLLTLLKNRSTSKEKGVYSCCSANDLVIRACIRRAKENNTVALIEATANQVNQFGGYTGMTAQDYHDFVLEIASEEEFPSEKLILGGDHLGPLPWQNLCETEAMKNAEILVRDFVLAGFTKIHIDTSMFVADDDHAKVLSNDTISRRGAFLCKVCEDAFLTYQKSHADVPAPVYVIGSEVPVPGGSLENEDSVQVTSVQSCLETLGSFRHAFIAAGVQDAWDRVVGIVVQPGVEFADESIVAYDREKARELMASLNKYPNLVFEGHSTDYQPRECLKSMVEDGVGILKVGPALTFALREGLYALESIEKELLNLHTFTPSRFRKVLETVMLENNVYWHKYYHGEDPEREYARAFSFSDRARYYLPEARVRKAIDTLCHNLDTYGIPQGLLSQYLPLQNQRVRSGVLSVQAKDLLIDHIGDCIDDYLQAVLVK